MKATPIAMNWHPGLSIFAKESFLKEVGDEYGWLGGVDDTGSIRCILPYTIVRKAIFRMVRFRVETLYPDDEISMVQEKAFLNSAVDYFRSVGADMIIPATTNTIFRAYPDGCDAAPYGSYIIDLTLPEEHCGRISIESTGGMSIRNEGGGRDPDGAEHLEAAYELARDTLNGPSSHL